MPGFVVKLLFVPIIYIKLAAGSICTGECMLLGYSTGAVLSVTMDFWRAGSE